MIDYLTHYYQTFDKGPFQSLSALPQDAEAIRIMQQLCDDTPYGARFKDPVQYLHTRKATEQWVREAFIAKGGKTTRSISDPHGLGILAMAGRSLPQPRKAWRRSVFPSRCWRKMMSTSPTQTA